MATKKELVEAHAFSRRRLVTAFLSGAPGGREVEPARPARAVAGGTALAVLLCAGAAVAGYLGGRPDSRWTSPGSFVISKDTGEQYVVLRGGEDKVVQRVPNFISAQLLLGTHEPSVYTVRDSHIRTMPIGEDLGIEGAPAALPDPDRLVDDGWTACTGEESGVKVAMTGRPEARAADQEAFVVRTGDDTVWLVATGPTGEGHRFQLPARATQRSGVLDALGFAPAELAPVVPEGWLNLFPAGSPLTLDSFGVAKDGDPVDYPGLQTDLSDHRIGTLLEDDGGYVLLGDEGPQRLEEFAGLVHVALQGPAQRLTGRLQGNWVPTTHPEEWPLTTPSPVEGEQMCAVLREDDGVGRVTVGVDPGPAASAAEVAEDTHEVAVDPAGGAYVLSGGGSGEAGGSPYVVDAKGKKYPLVGPDVPSFIGYGDVDPVTVPAAWLEYFADEVALSVNAARRVPEDAADPSEEE